jgi:hypothetical protein
MYGVGPVQGKHKAPVEQLAPARLEGFRQLTKQTANITFPHTCCVQVSILHLIIHNTTSLAPVNSSCPALLHPRFCHCMAGCRHF